MTRIGAVELSKHLGLPEPTEQQAAVIEAPLGPAVVIAGAGSGKTETMAARVVWLVANRMVTPDAVLGLTFTRKAAMELGRRVRRRLAQWRAVVEREAMFDGPGDADQHAERVAELTAGEPTILTYAAYAGRLVAEHAMRVGAEPDARLISPAVAWQLADQVSRNHAAPLPEDIGAVGSVPRYVLAMAGQFADHLVAPEDVERYCTDTMQWFDGLPRGKSIRSDYPKPTDAFATSLRHRRALLPLVAAYARAKRELGAVDFGDQMAVAAQLAQLPAVRQAERIRFHAVLLDEYQDTGHAQIQTLAGLFGPSPDEHAQEVFDTSHAVTAVGDPFQSIYGWRGASSGNITRFAGRFRHHDGRPADVFALATSFRNDEAVLRAANDLSAPLRSGYASLELQPAPAAGAGAIALTRTETVDDEARWVADRLKAAWDDLPPGDRTAAVLVRRRSQIPLLADTLLAAGLPVEVVGLGGLLTTPEVVDVVATLRVLVRHDAGTALVRLLTGARWRIGPSDLAALAARARALGRVHAPTPPPVQGDLFTETGVVTPSPPSEPISIVEALDDLGAPDSYSPAGYARMAALANELRRLRRRVTAPLPELVADVEHTIGVDLEVAARPDRLRIGRAHLDRFLDEAADFANEADEATLTAFLAYLEAAEDEENGLDVGEIVVDAERVQILTVHGAKGLEWDVVAVPGLVDGVFPAKSASANWAQARQELPAPLRGDRADLPALDLDGAVDRKDVRDRLVRHKDEVTDRHALEERRLGYVALTRARHVLLVSGYVWDTAIKPRDVSPFLTELRPHAEVDGWFEADDGAPNPLITEPRESQWPLDPFGPYPGDRHPGRRADVLAGAELVRAASTAASTVASTVATAETAAVSPPAAEGGTVAPGAPPTGLAGEWAELVDRLLEERAASGARDVVDVELPGQLSVSQLVELGRDPAELARSIRRPVPRPPAPWARRGTAFHTWLEQRWDRQSLIDIDELPGAADEHADDADFVELRTAFESSEWAKRTPAEVEVPFEMVIAGRVVRGRMDAVFSDLDPATGAERWVVVDWKTGRRPVGAAAHAAAVQLAAYRLAWTRLVGLDDNVARVRAAFHYVRSNETVEPAALLDADGLRRLLGG